VNRPFCYQEMFKVSDFFRRSLCHCTPRLGVALGWFFLGLYINCVSNAEVQRMVAGFYEAEWGYSKPDYQSAQRWLRQHEGGIYERIWGDTSPNETQPASPEAMQKYYQNRTVVLYDLTFLYAGYYGFPPVHTTLWADRWVAMSIVMGLVRFVILPGPQSMRWTFLMRVFFVLGLLYLWRSITIFLTPLPNPDPTCVPKISHPDSILWEGLAAFTGDKTCQDVMFSGHTLMGTTWTLFSSRYVQKAPWFECARELVPKRALHLVFWVWQVCGWYAIAASHFHYSLDVFVGVVLTYVSYHLYHAKIHSLQSESKSFFGYYLRKVLLWLEKGARDVPFLTALGPENDGAQMSRIPLLQA